MLEHENVVLHIRKPQGATGEYQQYLDSIAPQLHHRIVLHGAFELTADYNVKGIHLNSYIRTGKEFDTITQTYAKPGLTISSSFHNWQEITETRFSFDAAFISPVFDSISKKGYKAAIKLEECRNVQLQLQEKHPHRPHILGLGGVDRHNIQQLHQNGFDGAVLLGSIWKSKEPLKALQALLNGLT